ncbi:MAG: AtpZ/AtpI family protein [Cellulosilyticum sp.]|nr:AtpZ/AtpI family protein [Cellulosilyticum sp.]
MKKNTWMRGLSLLSQLGIVMITPILMCTFIGVFLDELTHKGPLFTIVFILLGTGGAFRNLFYHTTRQAKKIKKEDKDE